MRWNIDVLGLKLLVEVVGTHWAYVSTNWFEAFWSRHERFEGKNGEVRHWCFDRKGIAA
ncbi:hypothetical protein [Gellertiella hungarica]|uniref:Uncharacterized protein n=1 Tax=Gellertiella hungarica TaxID=1572859 RepID=A0A7W6NJC3_9HYPH|nr:hypothetical protein [Gellertiella hungarica]MBB4064235.1 hypothetical protein [Gellertiella hungarica]